MSAPLPPMLEGSAVSGHYREFQKDPLGLFTRALAAHGEVVRVRFFHIPVTVVNDPEAVREVLATSADNFPRDSKSSRLMRQFIGDGILTANGEHWRRQREALSPHLQGEAMQEVWPLAEAVLEEGFARCDDTVDIAREARVMGFRILSQLLFAYEATWEEAEAFTDAATFAQEDVMDRLLSLAPPPLFLPLGRNRRLRAAMGVAHDTCAKLLRGGSREQSGRSTYLDVVLEEAARAAGRGRRPDEAWARQLMMTLLIVGSENPSNTVAWVLALLARHPDWLRAVREELERAGPLRDVADLSRAPLLHRVVHEALRLYPGGWGLDRKALRAHTLGGFHVPAGAVVVVSPFLMHRNARFWKQPEVFDPDRFLPQRKEATPKFAFFPFGGGPHQCLGPRYAYQIIPLMLARLLQRFDYQLVTPQLPRPLPLFTLRPEGGVQLRLQRRC